MALQQAEGAEIARSGGDGLLGVQHARAAFKDGILFFPLSPPPPKKFVDERLLFSALTAQLSVRKTATNECHY